MLRPGVLLLRNPGVDGAALQQRAERDEIVVTGPAARSTTFEQEMTAGEARDDLKLTGGRVSADERSRWQPPCFKAKAIGRL